ncbi:glycosyltransferase [Thiocystis violacea]|uniref:glycosyltransferase n=1 Tax=Thiocystis violacea TaxID=13725 RepID=UPI0019031F8F|nr:glycosyltransferase [Thiocystis violacea]MBK1720333.1 hypothetical protein [Thiocystis violacea]
MIYIGMAAVSFVALIYPYLIYPLLLRAFPKRPVSLAEHAPVPARYALVFCAYNEETALPEKIANIREIKALLPDLQVVAYSDYSTDGTVALLRNASDVLTLIEGKERAGKATGMRRMVDSLDVDVIIFTDANVILEPRSARRILQYFSIPEIGCVAGTLHYSNPEASTTAQVGSLYWRLEESIKQLESATGSTMGADGSIFAARRELYPEVPPNLLDDMIVSMTPLFHGRRVVSAPDVMAFEKSATSSIDEFQRKRRIACRGYKTYLYLTPKISAMEVVDRFKFVSHKVMRWFGVVPMVLIIVFSLLSLFLMAGITATLFIVFSFIFLAYALSIFGIPLLNAGVEIAISILASGIGIIDALRNHDYTVWKPAKSRS